MRTDIESHSWDDPRIGAYLIIQKDDEKILDVDGGFLDELAEAAQDLGREACLGPDCQLAVVSGMTGNGELHEISACCMASPEHCGFNDQAVLRVYDFITEVTQVAGVEDKPIEDWDNLQSRPAIEAAYYLD